ncbi:MAG: hypothetical protein NC923_03770 [Candidatus Omnitrophica bacterium]|nr:hypothetical protein [Candidatus Omnitrophota bacterium]
MSKKKWQRPKLVVLIRNSKEERVLEGCKRHDEAQPSSQCCSGSYNSEQGYCETEAVS